MKSILLLISVFIVVSSGAQITVTKSSMPAANDTFHYVTTQPLALSSQVAKTGANQTWVFKLSDSLSTSDMEYKSSLKTPYAFYFFNTVGLKIADNLGMGQFALSDVYQFFSNTNSGYKVEGLGFKISLSSLPLAGNYSDEDELFHFPLTYGRRDSSTFKVSINIPLVGSYKQSGYRISEVLGHGKAILVTDTFDALLVRSYIKSADTIASTFGDFGFPNERVEYKWVTDARKGLLAEVTGTEVAGNFVPAQSKFMYFEPKTSGNPGGGGGGTGISSIVPVQFTVYPNPSTGLINFKAEMQKAEIYSLKGKLLKEASMMDSMDLSGFKGIYILKLWDKQGQVAIQRISVY